MFHARLFELREKTGLSQAELSKKLGMARTTYAGYETGAREPDLKTLTRLADWFGVDLNWLVAGEEKKMVEEDALLLKKFSSLNENDQNYILELMERLIKE